MEPLVRIKPEPLKALTKMLAPDEKLLVAVPHGKMGMEPGKIQKHHEVDYFLLTDKRIIVVKGKFFKDRSGFSAYPRRLCIDADAKFFLVGCNVKIRLRDERDESGESILEITNLRKPEAGAIARELGKHEVVRRHCPKCSGELDKDYTFCPNCGASLKKICPKCGKTLLKDSISCPLCGD